MDKVLNKILSISILVIVIFIINSKYPIKELIENIKSNKTQITENVDTTNKQIIEVNAKGGYSPQEINAEANKDTVLRVKTDNTFDCSSSLVIPKLNIRKQLPPSGITDIAIPAQEKGTKIPAACAMGMYRFNINFN